MKPLHRGMEIIRENGRYVVLGAVRPISFRTLLEARKFVEYCPPKEDDPISDWVDYRQRMETWPSSGQLGPLKDTVGKTIAAICPSWATMTSSSIDNL
jgi:hypothetical protein